MARAGSNHKGGRPKGSLATHTLDAQEAKKALIARYIKQAEEVDGALLDKAVEGDIPAIQEGEMTGKDGKDLMPSPTIKELAHALLEIQRQRISTSDESVS